MIGFEHLQYGLDDRGRPRVPHDGVITVPAGQHGPEVERINRSGLVRIAPAEGRGPLRWFVETSLGMSTQAFVTAEAIAEANRLLAKPDLLTPYYTPPPARPAAPPLVDGSIAVTFDKPYAAAPAITAARSSTGRTLTIGAEVSTRGDAAPTDGFPYG